ncbi:ATP-binding cassette domain-containing protein [Streptomyces sp. NPDC002643]
MSDSEVQGLSVPGSPYRRSAAAGACWFPAEGLKHMATARRRSATPCVLSADVGLGRAGTGHVPRKRGAMTDRAAGGIRAVELTKRFGDVHPLNGLNLEVPPGKVLGPLGQNGAGNTTTVNILTTLVRPDGGAAWGRPQHGSPGTPGPPVHRRLRSGDRRRTAAHRGGEP